MSDHDQHNKQPTRQGGRDQASDPARPSQAEGDRETVEEALGEQGKTGQTRRGGRSDSAAADRRSRTNDPGRPSQAEGERGTVKEDMREKS